MVTSALRQPVAADRSRWPLVWTVTAECGASTQVLVRWYDDSEQPRVSRCTVVYDLGQLEKIISDDELTEDAHDELAADVDRWMNGQATQWEVSTQAEVRNIGESRADREFDRDQAEQHDKYLRLFGAQWLESL